MQVSLRYQHLPDLYRTYRIPFAHTGLVPLQYLHTSAGKYFCGPVPFYYRDSGTSTIPANIIWPSIVIPVLIIYQLISSGLVPFFYRDTSTRSITANSFCTGAVFLLGYWYPQFTDKYCKTQIICVLEIFVLLASSMKT